MTTKYEDVDKILTMIEGCDPGDTQKLDEIDARVWCYVLFRPFKCMCSLKGCVTEIDTLPHSTKDFPRYSRSRDALKAIRPDEWRIEIKQHTHSYEGGLVQSTTGRYLSYKKSPTEELAELHAILQAIKYERTEGKE